MNRKGIYSIEEVLSKVIFVSKIKGKSMLVDFDGNLINMASDRYKTFKKKGVKCKEKDCNLEGKFFAMEKSTPRTNLYHFNLYAIDKDGNEVLMTKDHIHPKSKGEEGKLENYEPMCTRCNIKKGNKIRKK